MLSASNGRHISNGRITPINGDIVKQEIKYTNTIAPNDPIEPKQDIAKKNFIYRLFQKDKNKIEKEKEPVQKKKPEGPKLKRFEIVCFQFI
jgi:hypothetical protein